MRGRSGHIQNKPRVRNVNLESMKHVKSTVPLAVPFGVLDFTKSTGGTQQARIRKAKIRVPHFHPYLDHPARRMNGKITPPKPAPTIANPIARPALRWKYCGTTERADVLRRAALPPVKTPKHNRNCQYTLHSANRKKPVT